MRRRPSGSRPPPWPRSACPRGRPPGGHGGMVALLCCDSADCEAIPLAGHQHTGRPDDEPRQGRPNTSAARQVCSPAGAANSLGGPARRTAGAGCTPRGTASWQARACPSARQGPACWVRCGGGVMWGLAGQGGGAALVGCASPRAVFVHERSGRQARPWPPPTHPLHGTGCHCRPWLPQLTRGPPCRRYSVAAAGIVVAVARTATWHVRRNQDVL